MNMISGIGTDIIEVERIERLLQKDNSFQNKIFSPDEVAYCESKKNKCESYAARFAAKEAVFKALGTGWRGEMAFNEIEVLNDELGKPYLRLTGKVKEYLDKENIEKAHISLSHLKSLAIAFVVLEKKNT
jgi:holo-[acyl-carrier protein] synthase